MRTKNAIKVKRLYFIPIILSVLLLFSLTVFNAARLLLSVSAEQTNITQAFDIQKKYDGLTEELKISEGDVSACHWEKAVTTGGFVSYAPCPLPVANDGKTLLVKNVSDSGGYRAKIILNDAAEPIYEYFSVSIVPAELTAVITGGLEDKAYGDMNLNFPVTVTGFVDDEDASVLNFSGVYYEFGSAETPRPVGTHTVKPQGITAQHGNYVIAYRETAFNVVQAEPDFAGIEPLSATVGDTLSSIALPSNLTWAEPDAVVEEAGSSLFAAIYDCGDSNYKKITVFLTVTAEHLAMSAEMFQSEYTYDGSEHTFVPERGYYTIDKSSVNVAKDAGNYIVKLLLNDAHCYNADDAEADELALTFKILPREVKLPDDVTLIHSGYAQTPAAPDDSPFTYTCNAYTNAGAYPDAVRVSLNSTHNHYWTGGGTEDIYINLVISPMSIEVPIASAVEFTYNGQWQSIGLPESPYYRITHGTHINAGSYNALVTLVSTNFVWGTGNDETLVYPYVINKAEIDTAGILFESRTFAYDGTEKHLEVTGLPADINVTYTGNYRILGGKYDVTAEFDTGGNYTGIAPMRAQLVIEYVLGVQEGQFVDSGFLDDYVYGDKLPLPSRKGYKFVGWYYDSQYKFAAKSITAEDLDDTSILLYAKWEKKLSGGAITGIVIGSVAISGAAAFAAVYFIRRRIKRS